MCENQKPPKDAKCDFWVEEKEDHCEKDAIIFEYYACDSKYLCLEHLNKEFNELGLKVTKI